MSGGLPGRSSSETDTSPSTGSKETPLLCESAGACTFVLLTEREREVGRGDSEECRVRLAAKDPGFGSESNQAEKVNCESVKTSGRSGSV